MEASLIQVTQFLKRHERSIINGNSKLSLPASLLQDINFTVHEAEYNKTFQFNQPSLEIELLDYLCFIISKVPKLTVTQTIKSERLRVDISRFEHLNYLELKNIPIHTVEGLKSLHHQIKVLICDNVATCIADIFSCLDTWEELHTAKLCSNDFGSLYQLDNTPYLQYIDLSYNRLKDQVRLNTLRNLKYLNLSFNNLTSLPMLNEYGYNSLRVILINNNLIEELSTMDLFIALETADLSYNIISDHSALSPLTSLSNLLSINLLNNPISYHPRHRIYTCSRINSNVNLNNFLLDGRMLNSEEKKEIFPFGCRITDKLISQHQNLSITHSLKQSVIGIKRKAKCAVIETYPKEPKQVAIVTKNTTIKKRSNNKIVKPNYNNSFISQSSNIQTESVVVELKGNSSVSSMFHNCSLTCLQNIVELNIACTMSTNPCNNMLLTLCKLPKLSMTSNKRYEVECSEIYENLLAELMSENICHGNDLEDDWDVYENLLITGAQPKLESKMKISETTNEENEVEINSNEGNYKDADDVSISSDETFDELFLVQRKLHNGDVIDVFVVLDKGRIREKSVINGRTVSTWSFRSIESCEQLTTDPSTIKIIFNRVLKESRERIYFMDNLDADKLFKKIRLFLEARSLSSLNQRVYSCLKCDSIFSQEFQNYILSSKVFDGRKFSEQKTAVECLTCGSDLVVREEDGFCSKLQLNTSSNSPTSSLSGNTLVKLPGVDFSGGRQNSRKGLSLLITGNESDIEVISNPSQSSIEVLEVVTRVSSSSPKSSLKHNSRKYSDIDWHWKNTVSGNEAGQSLPRILTESFKDNDNSNEVEKTSVSN